MESSQAAVAGTSVALVQPLPVAQIYTSPHQMRRHFDPVTLRELSKSMREEGLIQPIVVRKVGGSYELIAGERRLRAAEMLGWETIEARILEVTDEGAAVKGLIENLQRADLDPIEEARGYQQLAEPPYQMTQEEIARRVGKSQPAIARALALLALPPEVQSLMPRGMVTESHARQIRKLTDPARQVELAQRIDKEGWSVRETEQWVRREVGLARNGNGSVQGPDTPATAASPARRKSDHLAPNDPLAELWPRLIFTPAVTAPGTWDIRYEGEGLWQLEVWAEPGDARQSLGRFFTRLGESLLEPSRNGSSQPVSEES